MTSEYRLWFCILIFVANTIVYAVMFVVMGETKFLWAAPIGGIMAAVITHASLAVIPVHEEKNTSKR